MEQMVGEQLPLAISDQTLVVEARGGNTGAFDELVARHQERVFALAYRILGNAEDAADVQQETFVRAWTHLRKFQQQSAFTTWLHRIAVNACLSRRRVRPADREVPFEEDQRPHHDRAGVACMEGVETSVAVRELLSTIPAYPRTLLVLREVEGRSLEEIAEIVGRPVGSIGTQLYRARLLFREKLRPYMEEEHR